MAVMDGKTITHRVSTIFHVQNSRSVTVKFRYVLWTNVENRCKTTRMDDSVSNIYPYKIYAESYLVGDLSGSAVQRRAMIKHIEHGSSNGNPASYDFPILVYAA